MDIMMTEQRWQELIEYVETVLSAHVQYGGDSDEEDVFKISLASLTAVPFRIVECSGEVDMDVTNDRFELFQDNERWLLYTAPPVPVIRLPDDDFELGEAHGIQRRVDFRNGANYAIAEIKRLNGLGE